MCCAGWSSVACAGLGAARRVGKGDWFRYCTDVDPMHDPDPSRPNPSNAAPWHAPSYLFTGRRAFELPIPRMRRRIGTGKVRILLKLSFFDVVCLNFTHLVRLSSSQGLGMSRGRSAAADDHVPILGSVRPSTLVRLVAGNKHFPTFGYADVPGEHESYRRPIRVSSCSFCLWDLVLTL